MARLPRQALAQLGAEEVVRAGGKEIVIPEPGGDPGAGHVRPPGDLAPALMLQNPGRDEFPRHPACPVAPHGAQVAQPAEAVQPGEPGRVAVDRSARKGCRDGRLVAQQLLAARRLSGPGVARHHPQFAGCRSGEGEAVERTGKKMAPQRLPCRAAAQLRSLPDHGRSARSREMLAAYPDGPSRNTAVPATSTSAPAATARRAVSGSTPPSTSRSTARPDAAILRRKASILRSWDSMKDWPPNPGLTLITSTRSISSIR